MPDELFAVAEAPAEGCGDCRPALPCWRHAAPPPERGLSPDQKRTRRNRAALDAGRHPATHRPLLHPEWGMSCRDCTHAVGIGRSRTYWKCELHWDGVTRGPATDIRIGWPACDRLRIDPADAQAVTR